MHPALCPMASGWQVFVRLVMASAAPCASRGLSGVDRRELAAGSLRVSRRLAVFSSENEWRICMRLREGTC